MDSFACQEGEHHSLLNESGTKLIRNAATVGEFSDPIHDNARHIVGINSAFRSGEFGDQNWDEQLFAFGHDGAGNYFCFYTTKIDEGVFLRDHETREITKECNSFDNLLLQWSGRVPGNSTHEDERLAVAKRRRWWAFWR